MVSYYGQNERIGVVFSSDKFAEWQRRTKLIEKMTDVRQICTQAGVDWLVSSAPIPAIEPLAIQPGAHLYSCAMLRAVLPAPTVVGVAVQ
jgi:hypothetical protein